MLTGSPSLIVLLAKEFWEYQSWFSEVRPMRARMAAFYTVFWQSTCISMWDFNDAGRISHTPSACVWVISCVCDSVCLCVRPLKEKQLELSTPNLVQRKRSSWGQKVKGQGYVVIKCNAWPFRFSISDRLFRFRQCSLHFFGRGPPVS